MIYVFLLAVISAAAGVYYRLRKQDFAHLVLDVIAAAVSGWLAGLLLGVGARIGMWAVPFFNGTEPHFSIAGSLNVVLTFSLFGIAIGVLYELAFRRLFHERGILFGFAITVLTVYPLGSQGIELLTFSPPLLPLALLTFLFIAVIFVPYAAALEYLVGRWHRSRDVSTVSLSSLQKS